MLGRMVASDCGDYPIGQSNLCLIVFAYHQIVGGCIHYMVPYRPPEKMYHPVLSPELEDMITKC